MNELRVLLQKEWREQVRNFKLLWIPIFFIIFGLIEPLSNYYLPQILEKFGGLPEGMNITMPELSGYEILVSLMGQYQLIGILVIVLAFMGAISGERKTGTATLLYVRPMKYSNYFLSKWLVINAVVVGSVWLGFIVSWYYTNQLFEPVKAGEFVAFVASYSVWMMFIITIVLALSATFSTGVTATLGLIISLLYPVIDSLILAIVKVSPFKLTNYAAEWFYVYSDMTYFWWSLALTVVCIVLICLLGMWMCQKNAYKTTI